MSSEVTTIFAILLLLLLCTSFCVAGAEVAFFSLSYKDINYLKTKPQSRYKRIISLLDDPKTLLNCMLIANSLTNIGIIVLGSFMLDTYLHLPGFWLQFGVKVLILATVVLLVAEILPKVLATQNNVRFAKDVGWMVEGIYLLFNRIARSLGNFSDRLEKLLGQRTKSSTKEEMHAAIDLTTPENDKGILMGIVDFGDKTVKQIMRARMDVSGINYNTSFADLKLQVEELHYSRLPVYQDTLDEIKGTIHTKDLLPHLNETAYDWHTAMRQPYFVHEQKPIEDLLQEFQKKRIHFAVVVDEFGGTSGIITLEDILEEVIGDIKDEFDEEDARSAKIDDLNYVFEGKTTLTDVCREMGLQSDTFDGIKGDSDSLAGLLLEIAGEIPSENQVIESGDFQFTVLELSKNRINKVQVTIKPSPEE